MTTPNPLQGIDPTKLEELKEKITHFQAVYDNLKHRLPTLEKQVQTLAQDLPELEALKNWYTSADWMSSYDLDGEGAFTHIKRGVLSQDEVSNLLESYLGLADDLSTLANQMKSILTETK